MQGVHTIGWMERLDVRNGHRVMDSEGHGFSKWMQGVRDRYREGPTTGTEEWMQGKDVGNRYR